VSSSDDLVITSFFPGEPGPDQRWSTWPLTTPTQRGPEPRPEWVITASGAWDTELGVLKTGKEADVHLLERGLPGEAGVVLAAKRYRDPDHRDFHRSSQYTEGRRLRRSRDTRAVARGSTYGRQVQAGAWAAAEFDALSRLRMLGAPVPYPVQVLGTELLLEFIGDGRAAAPRLAEARVGAAELESLFDQVRSVLLLLADHGWAHGDLSPYNLLVHHGRVVVIDLPQLVDVVSNPSGFELLERDCRVTAEWFERRGLDVDVRALTDEVFSCLR
jgi:RIO kinase 1